MSVQVPRLVVAGLSGDSGKTIASLSLVAGLRRRGLNVAVFKKGPDYIDPAWLGRAAGSLCRNLDTYLVDTDSVVRTFAHHAAPADIAVVEGNRGLFDGKDSQGSHSTAELAHLLHAPVVLVVDATKTTRTLAALVMGCQAFDTRLPLKGVILNRIAGTRHEQITRQTIEHYCQVPVVGAIGKLSPVDASLIPGRHLGLVPPSEFDRGDEFDSRLADVADRYFDIDRLLSLAATAEPFAPDLPSVSTPVNESVRIGFFRDSVFTFYYPENLEHLEACGAELVPVSSTDDTSLPDLDAFYIGGGFPETHAAQLSGNTALMAAMREATRAGMPVYAECGGLIYLSRSIRWGDTSHAMAGVLDLELVMKKRPAGHGYMEMEVDTPNPFFSTGTVLKGHEFHYSQSVAEVNRRQTVMSVRTGVGLGQGRDGFVAGNVYAGYCHIHADGVPEWAPGLVRAAARYRELRTAARSTGTRDDTENDRVAAAAAAGY